MSQAPAMPSFSTVSARCGRSSGLQQRSKTDHYGPTTGARLWESELHRIAGNLLFSSATLDVERSEAHYLRAINVAREQDAASLDLRASTSLARLWAHHGDRRKAYDLLAPVYAWFTEGFETRDLVDAKELLDQLR